MKIVTILLMMALSLYGAGNYPIVDTNQSEFYSDESIIDSPSSGDSFYGQDSQYSGNQPDYTDNGNGTITDNVTGLIWQKDMGDKVSFEDALSNVESSTLGGYTDWRLPTIKELYSLIDFTGIVGIADNESSYVLFIDDDYFVQPFGDTSLGERLIDAQTWSSTEYVGYTMDMKETVFGVNFIDGRIKGYPKDKSLSGETKKLYARFVRGNPEYGKNDFVDNGDGTITDYATGLMWQKSDNSEGLDWKSALSYAENLELAGYSDWRLPNIKELQSIANYSRSPQTTNSAAIDPIFNITEINDPDGNPGYYPFFWSGTTHIDGPDPYIKACYIAFGEGLGQMNGNLLDVHGAGCQRSDPKSGDPDDYPQFFGPQGDLLTVYNFVRSVRTITTDIEETENIITPDIELYNNYPNPFNPSTEISFKANISGNFKVIVYDITGSEVDTIFSGSVEEGRRQNVFWNGKDSNNSYVSSGVYFYEVKSGNYSVTGKMLLEK